MKKIILIASVLVSSLASTAQSFTMEKDTTKAYWIAAGYLVEMNNYAVAAGTSPISLTWRITDFQKGPKWTFDGFCDNNTCRYNETTGLLNGDSSFTTFSFSSADPKAKRSFKVDFNGDAADFGTKSSITAELTSGSTTQKATFIAYKGTAGIVTSVKLDDDISIFPNPASNYIDVLYNASSDVKTIAIYNLIGKVVNVYKVSDKNSARCEFNAEMPSGIYIVRIADSKGNVIATRKITHQ